MAVSARLSRAYAKLFCRSSHFNAKLAVAFQQLAGGSEEEINKVLDLSDDPWLEGEADGGRKIASEIGGPGKRKKQARDPNAPKRPRTAYQIFIVERQVAAKAEHADVKQKELMTLMAGEWKEMSQAEKEPYQKKAKEEKAAYEQKLQAYKSGGPGSGDVPAEGASDREGQEDEEREDEEELTQQPTVTQDPTENGTEEQEEDSGRKVGETPRKKKRDRSKEERKHRKHHKKKKSKKEGGGGDVPGVLFDSKP